MGVQGFGWDELTEWARVSHWRQVKSLVRYCKARDLHYEIHRRRK